jgi:glyoxylase-like metal-dependent hydrolase (beta-lactamase superfamily II)
MKTIAAVFLPVLIVTAQDRAAPITTLPVADGIYMLEGRGGNIGVSAGPDGLLLVDDKFANLVEPIEAALEAIHPGALRFVLNTHHHGDHVGGNAALASGGATIIAQHNVRKRLKQDGLEKAALPVITFDASLSIHFNDQEIQLMHHGPGHTDGDSVIHFTGANVIHMGDLFFNGRFPYVDLGAGGSVDGYIAAVQTVLDQAPGEVRIIPGHGPLASVADLKEFQAMLKETVGTVREAKSAGDSLEDIKAAGLPDKYAEWGSGFISTDRWIETIYHDTN